jgi:hypothetical protein
MCRGMLVAALLAPAAVGHAEVEHWHTVGEVRCFTSVSGVPSVPRLLRLPPPALVDFSFDVDWDAMTLHWTGVSLNLPGLHAVGSEEWTVGPGLTESGTVQLFWQPIQTDMPLDVSCGLVTLGHNRFGIEGGTITINEPTAFNGTWGLYRDMHVGGVLVESGTWSYALEHPATITFSEFTTDKSFPHIADGHIDFAGNPQLIFAGSSGPLFTGAIDGHEFSIGAGPLIVDLRSESALIVPAPSALALTAWFTIILAIAGLHRLRHRVA